MRLVGLMLAVMSVATGTAGATSPQRLTGGLLQRAPNGFRADGERYATGPLSSGGSVLYDDAGDRPRRITTPCPLGSVYHGRAGTICGGQSGVVTLPSLMPVPLLGELPGDTFDLYVGAAWTVGADAAFHAFVLDWRTGQRIATTSATDTYDLDHVPLRRITLAVGSTLTGRSDPHILAEQPWAFIHLRQGSRTVVVRRRCAGPSGCEQVQFGSGIVSWAEQDEACAFVVRTGRTGCWSPTAAQRRFVNQVPSIDPYPTHTARAMYVTTRAQGANDLDPTPPGVLPANQVTFRVSLRPLQKPARR